MSSGTGYVAGTPFTGGVDRRASKAQRKGRVCQESGCDTVLSMYNDGHHCALHAPMIVPRTRGKKIA